MKRRKNCGGSDRSAFNGAVLLATSLATCWRCLLPAPTTLLLAAHCSSRDKLAARGNTASPRDGAPVQALRTGSWR